MSNKKLESWLKQKNKHASSIYKDPGYSSFYKSYYGETDKPQKWGLSI